MKPFRSFRVYESDGKICGRLEATELEQLDPGNVVIQSHYSSINFKDALGATGAGKILRRFPMVAGIDVAGQVLRSEDPRYKVGQEVLVTGCGLGEDHDGGYSEVVRVPGDWVVPIPEGLTTKEAMILGTAGFTAALCLHRMEQNGQASDQGPIVVTGASGGVGLLATQILSQVNYRVLAVSGKSDSHKLLKDMGAIEVLEPGELDLGSRPLEKARWAGAIDNVGGDLLSGLIPHIDLWGNIACVGMAGGHSLKATVFPMILRGVSLLGISSTNCPMPLRQTLWKRLAQEWKPHALQQTLSKTVTLDNLEEGFASILQRKNWGRILVDCRAQDN
ncbi:MAG: YhdH/YhfP family quinone oxidoreductase [Bdellovibrionaceae bacterium]|nr:YhdH/YhfP family quinone oxidoreductase [Pseudobdellovibrionaceae bacterium]